MNFSKDMLFKQIDAVICDLRHLLISMEEFRENGDANKLQKRIEELEREVKFWQGNYGQLYRIYSELKDNQQKEKTHRYIQENLKDES